jgi:hypothetical protein
MKHTASKHNYFTLPLNLHFTHFKMTLNSLHTSSEVVSLNMAVLLPNRPASTMTTHDSSKVHRHVKRDTMYNKDIEKDL